LFQLLPSQFDFRFSIFNWQLAIFNEPAVVSNWDGVENDELKVLDQPADTIAWFLSGT